MLFLINENSLLWELSNTQDQNRHYSLNIWLVEVSMIAFYTQIHIVSPIFLPPKHSQEESEYSS